MHNENQHVLKEKTPRTKNIWLRLLKYVVTATLVSYFLYWVMSQMDLDSLKSFDNKRSDLFLVLLSIMPAKAWGWLSFFAIMLTSFWGEWRYFHWQSFPKEKPNVDDK